MAKQSERPVGLTKDTGWQIGVRRTLPIALADAWKLITSPGGVALWLGGDGDLTLDENTTYKLNDGTAGEMRVFKPGSHLRLTHHPPGWPRPSTIQVRTIASGEKTTIAFHQEHLPGPDEREARRAHFQAALDQLAEMTSAN